MDIEESTTLMNLKVPLSKKLNDVKPKEVKMIGDYQIEKTLGQGTFGKVK